MAGITLTQAETQLTNWLNASTAVSKSQSYNIDGKQLTRADAKFIREQIEYWDAKVKKLTEGGIRIKGATIVY